MTVRKLLDASLNEMKDDLVKMCRITESMIDGAIESLESKDVSLCDAICARDREVDGYELRIEQQCMRILLKQQPVVASDFKMVSAALKVITDVERIGDQAADICEIVKSLSTLPYSKDLTHIKKMGSLAVSMVHDGVDSFIRTDDSLAQSVIKSDDIMDDLFLVVKRELTELIKNDASAADEALLLLMVAKYLERIADHAVNVGEWTIYHETGIRVKG